MNICCSSIKMVSLDPDGKTPQEGMSIYTPTWSSVVLVEWLVSFFRTKTKNRSINLATTTTIRMEVKGGRAHRLSLPTCLRYKKTTTYSQNNLKIILQVIQEQNTLKIISNHTYETPMIPRYRVRNYEYLSQLHENSFIESGRQNGTRGHVDLCIKWIQNGFSGVQDELLENQD